jgi:hypothetical protein
MWWDVVITLLVICTCTCRVVSEVVTIQGHDATGALLPQLHVYSDAVATVGFREEMRDVCVSEGVSEEGGCEKWRREVEEVVYASEGVRRGRLGWVLQEDTSLLLKSEGVTERVSEGVGEAREKFMR